MDGSDKHDLTGLNAATVDAQHRTVWRKIIRGIGQPNLGDLYGVASIDIAAKLCSDMSVPFDDDDDDENLRKVLHGD